MRISEIYRERTRLGPDWAKSVRTFLSDFEKQAASHDGAAIAFSVPFGNNTYTFPVSADFTTECGVTVMAREMLNALKLTPEPGDLPVAQYWNGFPFPCGVILVTGAGASGKTPAGYAIAEQICADDENGFGLLRYGEPFCGYLKSEFMAGCELATLMAHHRAVVIDSIKDLLTDMSGQAMESGLARKAVSMLSRLSMTASELGCSVIIPINPSSLKETVAELIREVARSNVAMAVIHESETNSWKLLARTREGGMRVQGTAALVNDKGTPVFNVKAVDGGKVEASESDISAIFASFASLEQFPSALARRVTRNQPL